MQTRKLVKSGIIALIEGRDLETHLIAERVRFLRVGLVTPLPGGPGIIPAGMTTGARGAPLKRDWRRGLTPASSRSREARPGLSPGVRSPGQAPRRSAGRRARLR
jgi:hypothetical protein